MPQLFVLRIGVVNVPPAKIYKSIFRTTSMTSEAGLVFFQTAVVIWPQNFLDLNASVGGKN